MHCGHKLSISINNSSVYARELFKDVWAQPFIASIREASISGANGSTAQSAVCLDAACSKQASYHQ